MIIFSCDLHIIFSAELVYTTFHAWIRAALVWEAKQSRAGVLLVDLHGHGHPHEYIELGYRCRDT